MRVSRLSNAIGDASRVRRKCSCDNERTILRSNLSLRPGVRSERDETGEFGDSQRLRSGCLDRPCRHQRTRVRSASPGDGHLRQSRRSASHPCEKCRRDAAQLPRARTAVRHRLRWLVAIRDAATDGRRSDEICPGQAWTYTFDVTNEMVGAWPFHDHYRDIAMTINRGLVGGILVLTRDECDRLPRFELPKGLTDALAHSGSAAHHEDDDRDDHEGGEAHEDDHPHGDDHDPGHDEPGHHDEATLMLSTRATIVLPVARRVRRHIEIPASSMSGQARFPSSTIRARRFGCWRVVSPA